MKIFGKEIIISLLLVCSLLPFIPRLQSLWMTSMFMPSIFFFLGLMVIVFALLIWKEGATDERENWHRLEASRLAFLSAAVLLVIGIIVRTLDHTLDPWLLFTLMVMIAVKIGTRIFYSIKG